MDYQNSQMGQIPQPTNPMPQQPGRLSKKVLVIVIAVLAIIIVAGGVWAFRGKIFSPKVSSSPSTMPDETANWKTYTNTQFGFEFKYPTDLFLKNSDSDCVILANDNSGVIDSRIWICSYGNPQALSAEQWVRQNKDASQIGSQIEQINTEGLNGVKFIENGLTESSAVYMGQGETIVGLYVSNGSKMQDTRDKIINTLKFNKAEQSNLKIYQNIKYGYEFKYDPNIFTEPISKGNTGNPVAFSTKDYKVNVYGGKVESGADVNIQVFNSKPTEITEIGYKETSSKNIFVQGYNAKEFTGSSNTSEYIGVTIQRSGKFVVLYLRYVNGGNFSGVFDQILSTFKFTN